ncbi:MAG: hypothetical protein RR202_10570 [Bacteroidales bacterium]
MSTKQNTSVSIYALLDHFWALDDLHTFSGTASKLYYLLLRIANKNRWPAKFPYSDAKAAASLGVSTVTLKTARKQLEDSGLIKVTPGGHGHAQKTEYRIAGCYGCEFNKPEGCTAEKCPKEGSKNTPPNQAPTSANKAQGDKVGERVGDKVGSKNTPPNPTPLLLRQDIDKTKTLPQIKKEEEVFDFKNLEIPNDGVRRNFRALIEKLEKYKASPSEAHKIITASNYGQIGHPIWQAFSEINAAAGKIQSPIRFVFSKIAMSNFQNA